MVLGFDYLGLAHPKFPLKAAINHTPGGTAIGCFDDPFGNVIPALRKMLETGKFEAVRIHAHWADDHKIVPIDKLKQKLPKYQKLAEDFPSVKVYVSHSCEYDEQNATAVEIRVRLIEELAPKCIPVNSRWRGAIAGRAILESHGDVNVKAGEIASTDGISIYDMDAEAYMQKNADAAICFVWGARFNGREIPDPGQKPPKPMDRTAWPEKEYLRAVMRLTEPAGNPPPVFPSAKPFERPRLYKPFAEDSQGVATARENKPVIILPVKVLQLEVIAANGARLAKLPYGGDFAGGMHRYYCSGLYGFQLGQKARAACGSEFVWFKAGSALFGPVNPAFRYGYHRDN